MNIELDKDGLISLVKGMYVPYELMEHQLIAPQGSYTGGFKDEWNWNYSAFEDCSEKVIYEIYLMLKEAA